MTSLTDITTDRCPNRPAREITERCNIRALLTSREMPAPCSDVDILQDYRLVCPVQRNNTRWLKLHTGIWMESLI